jgi:hypothetical protein
MRTEGQDPTVVLAHEIAVAVIRDADRAERPAIFEAASAIAGNDRAATRFGQAISAALIDELRNSTSESAQTREPAA